MWGWDPRAEPVPTPGGTPVPSVPHYPTPALEGETFADRVPSGYRSDNVEYAPNWSAGNPWMPENPPTAGDPWALPEPTPPPDNGNDSPSPYGPSWNELFTSLGDYERAEPDASTGARWFPSWAFDLWGASVWPGQVPSGAWVRWLSEGEGEYWDDAGGSWIQFRRDF